MPVTMDNINPTITGIFGTILSLLLAWGVRKYLPSRIPNDRVEHICKVYEKRISVANLSSVFGFILGIMLYFFGIVPRNDWRGLGVGMGLISILPLSYFLFILKIRTIDGLIEIIDAFGIIHKTPRFLMYALFSSFLIIGLITVYTFINELHLWVSNQ